MAGRGQWLERFGGRLARFLTAPRPGKGAAPVSGLGSWLPYLKPGDVLLVEGSSRISTAIKYLTQSTWSHAALVLGPHPGPRDPIHLVEADVVEGVRCVPASIYLGSNVRICRPWGLDSAQRKAVTTHALARLGHQYDLRNIVDLARYLFPLPPVPSPWRRRLITLGSGDPTRAICSTLIAEAFQSEAYPILPELLDAAALRRGEPLPLQARHYSLVTPRDFDLSPFFEVRKPSFVLAREAGRALIYSDAINEAPLD